ncbi:MAG: tRNA uridine(34) 5-carboxymethylaminomethyl modification radical SAM/GNAT enzyme Elp3 [Thermoproteota archaeon]|nr:tRNA uridine(34) 5-carboxymethylaminomethyl modification radical SAM/GNAT enzyme Elp3 [Thermoproteota archaeon]
MTEEAGGDDSYNNNKAKQDKYYQQACKSIAEQIESSKNPLSLKQILKVIRHVASEYNLATIPRNEHIILYLQDNRYRHLLMVKPAKTASGVAVIAVMPKPYACPHGRCIYCPGGIEFNTPLSYTGTEPATKVAQRFSYDPYEQVRSKIEQLHSRGHDTGKTEVVVVGGTFPFMPEHYQRQFAKSCYDALNGSESSTLQQAIDRNETAENRCVGFTVETKPDYCKESHVDLMLELGVTRIEIGVQSLNNNVYRMVNRGHTLDDVVHAFKVARDSGYKIVAHMMPGLPGSSPEEDIKDFRRLFEDDAFKPDMLKIYPTLVLEHTGLYNMHRNGKYQAYSDDELVKVVVEAKKIVPEWVRIMRIQREIESKDIIAGPKSGNLRQIILKNLRQQGQRCRCIRCRETGLQRRYPPKEEVVLRRTDYNASGGREVFLSYETRGGDVMLGFLRLRKIARTHRYELDGSATVRELHVYGQVINIGGTDTGDSCQHKGLGMNLLKEAERISKDELRVDKIAVISAVGTRQYYKKLGYHQDGPYVSKVL